MGGPPPRVATPAFQIAGETQQTIVSTSGKPCYSAHVATTVSTHNLASTIADLRRGAGLTQGDLAAETGCSRAFIGLLETGKRADLSLTLAAAMCRALGVGLDALLPDPPVEDPVRRISGALRAHHCSPRAWEDGVTARCPLHAPRPLPVVLPDGQPATAREPSGAARRPGDLYVFYATDTRRRRRARLMVQCAAGCGAEDILAALGLPTRLLRIARVLRPAPEQATVAALVTSTGLARPFLESLGVRDTLRGVEIPYFGEDGRRIATRIRLRVTLAPRKPRPSLARPSERLPTVLPLATAPQRRRDARFTWAPGSRDTPYGLDRLAEARAVGRLLLVEGESDCWTGWAAGVPTLGLPGAGAPAGIGGRAETAELLQPGHFAGIHEVYVVQEPDRAGAAFARDVSARVGACGPTPRVLPFSPGVKDLNALYREDPAGFTRRLRERIAAKPTGG